MPPRTQPRPERPPSSCTAPRPRRRRRRRGVESEAELAFGELSALLAPAAGADAPRPQGVRGSLRTVVLRLLSSSDAAFMERMMLLAGFPPDRELPADAQEMPHVRRFLDGWGRPGDVGVVALDDGQRPLGAAWARILGEPLLRDDRGAAVAELAVAVEERARGRGVASALLDALAEAAGAVGHRELSLNVSPRNPARRLYLRCGFELPRRHGAVATLPTAPRRCRRVPAKPPHGRAAVWRSTVRALVP